MSRTIIICALAGILAVPAFGQGVDPLIGTWKLNLEKSTYIGLPASKSETATSIKEGEALIANVETVDAQGRSIKTVVTQIYDGVERPVTGNPNWDAAALTRNGDVINIVRFKDGKQVSIARNVIDPGKTLTATTGGVFNNQAFYIVAVYERQ
jgi:hypothetical protein